MKRHLQQGLSHYSTKQQQLKRQQRTKKKKATTPLAPFNLVRFRPQSILTLHLHYGCLHLRCPGNGSFHLSDGSLRGPPHGPCKPNGRGGGVEGVARAFSLMPRRSQMCRLVFCWRFIYWLGHGTECQKGELN
ncbi:hypothetical protein CEXT_534831 [Caerostris extrusa]|uniref:Uncharacterized protein n=1 Tax=Caerostris extrusa TaxID=172846 RepID=A0AAV4XTJ1_CAEEX|nr:hypothetical protein CEXT_534831 [Caerostris extrusa]